MWSTADGRRVYRAWWRVAAAGASLALMAAACSSDGDDDGDAAAVDEHEEDGHDDHADDGLAALMADHEHDVDDEELDPETQRLLDAQLADTLDLVAQYPTIADAEADGWQRAGQFSPGLGTHYLKGGASFTIRSTLDGDEGEDVQPMLIFDGLDADSPIAGFMFLSMGEEAPEGFAGGKDHWHQHTNVCLAQGPDGIEAPFGADLDHVTEEMCSDAGGSFVDVTTHMVHIWSVPGYESDMGVFGGVNQNITCPDGTYHRMPIDELGDSDTLCPS